MLNNSSAGQAVYEPFLGSGITLIAAETTGRICLAMELDPTYVDVAVKRWQAFTGAKATLLADGRSYDAVASERLATNDQQPSINRPETPATEDITCAAADPSRPASSSSPATQGSDR